LQVSPITTFLIGVSQLVLPLLADVRGQGVWLVRDGGGGGSGGGGATGREQSGGGRDSEHGYGKEFPKHDRLLNLRFSFRIDPQIASQSSFRTVVQNDARCDKGSTGKSIRTAQVRLNLLDVRRVMDHDNAHRAGVGN
jgi:hypothetical protein